jgi:hypothetical protein
VGLGGWGLGCGVWNMCVWGLGFGVRVGGFRGSGFGFRERVFALCSEGGGLRM